MKRQLLFILLMLVISGCRLDELHDDAVQPEGRAFSVGQAKEFFEKDLESGNVRCYQYLNGALTGLGVGMNANGIITSATNFIKELSDDKILAAFGRSIPLVGVAVGATQTFVAFTDGDSLTTGDYLNIISTILGGAALIPTPFPIVNGALGVASGIVGIVSTFFSYSMQSGLYMIETIHGTSVYVYVNSNLSV